MKTKILGILVCTLLMMSSALTIASSTTLGKSISITPSSSQPDVTVLVTQHSSSQSECTTLITCLDDNFVAEVDSNGTIIWMKTGLNMPIDAERLANGNTLITELYNFRVIEVDNSGIVVWEITGLYSPIDVERIVPEPKFNVTISKGFGVTVTIENIGTAEATNVEATITATGGLVIFGGTKTVAVGDIAIGVSGTAKSLPIGIGNIVIEVDVTCDEGMRSYENTDGLLLLFFIL